jgi:S-adenosylmethionine:tRNA ribosyltransferase-isomerase
MIPKEFLLETYNYQLDPHYIAQKPVSPAESAKLLVCTQGSTQPEISTYAQLPQLLDPKSVLYYNNSKVIPARLRFSLESYGKAKEKEGEIFFLGHIPGNQKQFEAFVSPGKLFPIGSIHQQAGCVFKVLSQTRKGRILECLE